MPGRISGMAQSVEMLALQVTAKLYVGGKISLSACEPCPRRVVWLTVGQELFVVVSLGVIITDEVRE